MSVQEILNSRASTRGFLPKAVPEQELQDIFAAAQRSASNCNTQPWEPIVISGEKLKTLEKEFLAIVTTGQLPNPDFNWGIKYSGVHKDRQWGSALALYSAMDIAREDKPARLTAMARNWQFFGAPHAVFFTMDKYLDIMGAVDIGIYAQNLTLLMHERGISSIMQGALGQYPGPVRQMFNLAEERGVLFGMSFGYADSEHPSNKCITDREPLADVVRFEA